MKGISRSIRHASSSPRSRGYLRVVVAFVGVLVCGSLASPSTAAESARQSFEVVVPPSSVVQRPVETTVSALLDSEEQSFPVQAWKIRSNSHTGVVVDFAVDTPFVHTEFPAYQMDTSLEVAVSSPSGPGQWTIPQSQSQTNIASSQPAASVRVETDSFGVADVALTVGVTEANLTELMPGRYQSTVQVTIMPR